MLMNLLAHNGIEHSNVVEATSHWTITTLGTVALVAIAAAILVVISKKIFAKESAKVRREK